MPAGSQGAQGFQGTQGAQGTQGTQGSQGTQGGGDQYDWSGVVAADTNLGGFAILRLALVPWGHFATNVAPPFVVAGDPIPGMTPIVGGCFFNEATTLSNPELILSISTLTLSPLDQTTLRVRLFSQPYALGANPAAGAPAPTQSTVVASLVNPPNIAALTTYRIQGTGTLNVVAGDAVYAVFEIASTSVFTQSVALNAQASFIVTGV